MGSSAFRKLGFRPLPPALPYHDETKEHKINQANRDATEIEENHNLTKHKINQASRDATEIKEM